MPDRDDYVRHWKETAEQDFLTMQHLYEKGDYAWCLFLGHLVVEKLLKACYVKQVGIRVPRTHDLLRIASEAGLKVAESRQQVLDRLTTFNLNVRYPDFEGELRRTATREFAVDQIRAVEEIRKWLLKMLC